ncbi:ATP-dependent DNA helicase homolog RECG, chloroplastic [Mercurialis annua]|uniref:ATP-dependent DNA helicase homolog RECG, chloroplastic n=1 Tax=Mercurialis annua TaxID=3986 RepID=UPI00215F312C|nr:ATP-dependent DNA helicase homolog RECG, chloroplastic [Mercurialis annua]
MALTLSDCASGKQLGYVIIFNSGGGHQVASDRRMRFTHFLLNISKTHIRSKHKFAKKLVKQIDVDDIQSNFAGSKLFTQASALMGYDGFDDLIENGTVEKLCGLEDAIDDIDLNLVCKRFPSIVLGSSPPVKLYDETAEKSEMKSLLAAETYRGIVSDALGMKWVDPDEFYEELSYEDVPPSSKSSIAKQEKDESPCVITEPREQKVYLSKESKEENVNILPLHPEDLPSEAEDNLDHKISMKVSSTKVVPESILSGALLDTPISCIPGLSKRQCNQLENCGFHTFRKLLNHFPRTYADLQNAQVGVNDGQYLISVGRILSSRGIKANSYLSFLEVVVGCEVADDSQQKDIDNERRKTIYLHLKNFFRGARFTYQPFLKCLENKHKLGDVVCVSGKVKTMSTKDHYEVREYNIDVLKDDDDSSLHPEGRPYPIYPSKGGSNPNFLRDIIARAVQALGPGIDPIPKEITLEFGLLNLHDAYNGIHQPKNAEEADLARRRLIFDEFFYLQLARLFQMLEGLGTRMEKDTLLDKYRKPESNALLMEDWSSLTKKLLKALPFSLTSSQLSAISEIIWDLKRPVPMNRLLQGDVGCGKTVVAFLACMEVIGSGYQAAFMVPTELLAVQHYEHLLNLLEKVDEEKFKPAIALLTGSTSLKQARMIRKDLQSGDISMVIGTHSLISENVEFSALRIAVVDEQHRFGVIQRGRFNSKLFKTSLSSIMEATNVNGSSKGDVYMAPHFLAMSATPIPRTLALALYGDMSLTQITELPPGRIPVETLVVEGNFQGFEEIYKIILEELKSEGKVYLVYPVIEQSEQLPQLHAASADFEVISGRFPGYKCGLLHGKMKSDEKDDALRRFRSGETQILLSTQVIEVGVDVPDASMMVVMNAERFGIAQLHQLRGRVGRGARKSKCILMASTSSSLNRLKVLQKSSDGFYLANADLLLRGPGDLLGKKQSGHLPEFPIARLEIDGNILQEAHDAALKILSDCHDLERFPKLKTELSMRQPLCLLGD